MTTRPFAIARELLEAERERLLRSHYGDGSAGGCPACVRAAAIEAELLDLPLMAADDEDCGCGHVFSRHPDGGACVGMGSELDAIYGRPADEPCACPVFAPVVLR